MRTRFEKIRLVAMDVDGVLSDGGIFYDSMGSELKCFHSQDGYGIRRALRLGIRCAIISGRKSPMVSRRASELGIKDVYQEEGDKLAAYGKIKKKYRLSDEEICYIGDDEPDLPVLNAAGVSAAPVDAVPEILGKVDFVARRRGGRGAVREVLDAILRARNLI